MKLVFCPHCQDLFKLRYQDRVCECGKSWGRYEDEENARIGGSAIPLGIGNRSLVDALEDRPERGDGVSFAAFVIPKDVHSVVDEGIGRTLAFRGKKARAEEMVLLMSEMLGDRKKEKPVASRKKAF